jgi:hypothetical protein
MLSLDFVAKRYGKLPSEVVESGSSIDLQIANLAIAYENYLTKKHKDKEAGIIKPDLTQEEMTEMLERVRNKK